MNPLQLNEKKSPPQAFQSTIFNLINLRKESFRDAFSWKGFYTWDFNKIKWFFLLFKPFMVFTHWLKYLNKNKCIPYFLPCCCHSIKKNWLCSNDTKLRLINKNYCWTVQLWRGSYYVNGSKRMHGSKWVFGFTMFKWSIVYQFGTKIPLSLRLSRWFLGWKLWIDPRRSNAKTEHGRSGSYPCLSSDHFKWA